MKKKISGIYKITNLINGKCYIGKSNNIKLRWYDHKRKINDYDYPLYNAFRKYGIENFKFEIIEEVEENLLNEKEKFYIQEFNSFNEGYNCTLGGEGMYGFSHSDETKKKCSESQKGTKSSWWGRKHTEETKEKMSKWHTGKFVSEKTREKISKYHKGKKLTKETKKKISDGHKGLKLREKSSTAKKVICIETQEIFKCLLDAQEKYGSVKSQGISKCCNGKQKIAYGLHWMFYNEWKLLSILEQNYIKNIESNNQIICLNTGKIFKSMSEISIIYNMSIANIYNCVKGNQSYAGRDKKGNKLVWMYHSEWNKLSKEEQKKIKIKKLKKVRNLNKGGNNVQAKKVILLNNLEIFDTVTDASKRYNTSVTHISRCCKEKLKSSDKDKDGNKLVWKYYDDYLKEQ